VTPQRPYSRPRRVRVVLGQRAQQLRDEAPGAGVIGDAEVITVEDRDRLVEQRPDAGRRDRNSLGAEGHDQVLQPVPVDCQHLRREGARGAGAVGAKQNRREAVAGPAVSPQGAVAEIVVQGGRQGVVELSTVQPPVLDQVG
jgi:hypothetical protein